MCFVWSETEGARNIVLPVGQEDRRVREPAAILGRILREVRDPQSTHGSIYVLKDLHPYLDNNAIRRRLNYQNLTADWMSMNSL